MTVLAARQLDAFSILAARGKNLDSILYSRKLTTGSFARDLVLPEQLDYDEKRMSVWIDFANGNNRDGVGDVTEVTGIVTDRHRVNPICLFDHGKKVDLPIGLSEDPDTKTYTVEIDPVARIARGNIFFYQGKGLPDIERAKEFEHAIFCEQIFDLIVKRIIRGGSFGYTVIAAQPIQADYSTGTPQGLHLKATKLLEFGPTILPCSQDTVRKCLGENCCGKPLSPYLVKSLQPFAGQRKAQLGYEGKSTLGLGEPEKMSETNVPPSRWKPGAGAVKSIKDLRSKYRKGHQQRTRRSSAGTSLIYVHRKDWDAMKQVCEGRGLKLERSGADGDLDRVRLRGSDAVIDEVAKTFGRKKNKSLKGVGYPFPTKQEAEAKARQLEELMSKSMKTKAQFVEVLPGTGRERLSLSNETLANSPGGTEEIKTMKGKTKDLSTDETPADQANSQEVTSDLGNVQEGGEKIGAQVLRRLHQDHSILLEEYDGWLEALENDKVSGHLVQVLERLAECIEETESVWEKEYKDHGYEPLEGSKDLDGPQQPQEDQGEQNEEATKASEAPPEANQEAPTPEEAVDGMSGDAEEKEEKSLKLFNAKRVKHLRTFYKGLKTGNGAVIQDGAEVWHHADGGRHIPGREAAKEKPGSTPESIAVAGETGKNLKGRKGKQLGIEGSHEPGKEAEKQEKQKDLGIEGSHEPGEEAIHQEQRKGLHDHHKADVQDAHDFLGELGQTQTYGDEHRMKSYHFHKSLGGIATHLAKDFPELESMDDISNVQGPTGEREVRTNGAAQTKSAGGKCPKCGATMTVQPALDGVVHSAPVCPKCGYPGHEDNRKDFPAVDKQNNAVDVTKPNGPTEVHPGKEPAQQFGASADSPTSPKGTGYGDVGRTKEFPEVDQIDDTSEVSRVKGFHSALKNASGFFGQMASERAFGDAHKQKAGYCQKMLAGVLEQGFPQVDQQTNIAEVTEPLGDVSVKSLTDLLALRQKSINDMNAKLELMFSKS